MGFPWVSIQVLDSCDPIPLRRGLDPRRGLAQGLLRPAQRLVPPAGGCGDGWGEICG